MWLLILLALLVIVAAAMLFRRRTVFKITVRSRGPALEGAIPGRSWQEVRDFLETLQLPVGSAVLAYPDERGFRLEFRGAIPEPARQRIRNFLYLGL